MLQFTLYFHLPHCLIFPLTRYLHPLERMKRMAVDVWEENLDEIKGLGKPTVDKLHAAGIYDLTALAVTSGRELATLTGIDEKRASEICDQARRQLGLGVKLTTASELLEKRRTIARITTGSKALDGLLGGGVESQAMTELAGEFGSSKTQICHTLAATAQLPREMGGLGEEVKVLYIDTEGTFRPERVAQIASLHGLDPDRILQNIYVAQALSSDHLALIVGEAFHIVPRDGVKLVVVDSVTGRFRPEYSGREQLAERQQKLNRVLSRLLKLAEAYNVVMVVTNQVIATPGVSYGNPDHPAGGHVMAHASTYRIWLRRGRQRSRVAKMIDSPCHPENEATFWITAGGLEDTQPGESGEKVELGGLDPCLSAGASR